MRGRPAIGYVVAIDGTEVTLNLFDVHKGHIAAHHHGTSVVTEIGGLLGIHAGSRLLILKVQSLSFAEPREAHRITLQGGTNSEPLRHLVGNIVGRLSTREGRPEFAMDSLSAPALGAEVFPLDDTEVSSIFGTGQNFFAPVHLGDDLRGGGRLVVGLSDLISRHVAVLGSSGQGKSCFTAAVLQQVSTFARCRTVIFDINGEYESAFDSKKLPDHAVKVTRLGGNTEGGYRIPYYALGRHGLQRLLLPSEKTQRPALTFAIEHLNRVRSYTNVDGAGLSGDAGPFLFDDCRAGGANEAAQRIQQIRNSTAPLVTQWPNMTVLSALVAESYALTPRQNGWERNAFNYGNVSPLISRIVRFAEDPMFRAVVDTSGGAGSGVPLDLGRESTTLVERIFGGDQVDWRVHIVDLRQVTHDLMPFVLGSLLELYAFALFQRGQDQKIPTLLVLEEAHHYLRPVGVGDEAAANALAYERLAKEGRKFGLALWISTQRPSEVSPTVLSQCNNWICFRLTAEKDLAAVQAASDWVDRREVRRIAGLARQTAIAFGGSLQIPALIRAPTASPMPRSEDARFDDWNLTG